MTRRALLTLVIVIAAGGSQRAQAPEVYTLALGLFHATDQERQECYFGVGRSAMIVLHPKDIACQRAQELIGKDVRLQIVIVESH